MSHQKSVVLKMYSSSVTLLDADFIFSYDQWSERRGQHSFTSLFSLVQGVQIPSFNDTTPGYYVFLLLFAIIHWSPCQPPHSAWPFVTSLLFPPTPASLLPQCQHPFTSLFIQWPSPSATPALQSEVTLWTWPYWLPLWNLKTFILAYQHFIFTHLSSSAASINFPYSVSFPVQTRNIVYRFTCSLASTLTTTINNNDGTWNFFPLSWVISLSLMLQWNNSKYLPFNLFQWKDFTHLPFCLQACWPYSPWVSSVLPGKLNVFLFICQILT